jgi:beta-glucosidase/6-phospho-beta-glucosidase/beta-galactosidase
MPVKNVPRRPAAEQFRWAAGLEGSFIPHLNVDQYEWTQHNRFWKEDFHRIADELGCRWLRYPVPWHMLEPSPGKFDWRWTDERFEFARQLGLQMQVDLVHFGVPSWLPEAFGDLEFPAALERFSRAFGRQYSRSIGSVCPINEPLITALFCGDVGLWPPFARSLRNYTVLLSRVTFALNRSIKALRETMPEAELLVCDAIEWAAPAEEANSLPPPLRKQLEEDIFTRRHRRFVVLDLLAGQVTRGHPLYDWLIENRFPQTELRWFERNPAMPDLLGVDYYPHNEAELFVTADGQIRQRIPERPRGLEIMADYWERYRLPMMVTETNRSGSEKERCQWLESTVSDLRRLRQQGIPVIGYTWWPAIDHLDWDGAMLHQTGHIHPVGIYRLDRQPDGTLNRLATSVTASYRALIEEGDKAVGPLKENIPSAAARAQEEEPGLEPEPPPAPDGAPIIVHCHLRWEGVWQRPQQFLSRLSRRHRVLFSEGPILLNHEEPPSYRLSEARGHPNVTVLQMFLPASRFQDGAWVDEQRCRLLKEALQGPLAGRFDHPVQWFYDPMAVPAFLGRLQEQAVVYDCMDELSQFKFAPPEIVEREKKLLSSADLVFTGGRKLFHSKSRFNPHCHFYGCGVDVAHFSQARRKEEAPPDLAFVPKPVLGYFGVVDERLDYELIARLAEADSDWSVVMIGPLAKVDPAELPRRERLFWLGRREYAQLPLYAGVFDLCLMPFVLNESTEFINPTKALEYMATGRPIVSTAVPDVVSNFNSVVKIGRSHEQFLELCRQEIKCPDRQSVARGLEMAAENQWESVISKLEGHLEEALQRTRPSANRGKPGASVPRSSRSRSPR